jgi:glycosyltransferase involved in cell wall biosynthesis
MLEKVRKRADDFDVVHFHIDWLHLPLVREFSVATLTTLHGRLDRLELKALYFAFSDLPFVSVSDHQRQPLRNINWAGTVYHGLPRDLLPFKPQATGGYLAFLGRISPEKRPDRAIQIAARAGMPLKMAAKIDKVDQAYWEEMIAPMVKQNSSMEFVGEITEHEKADFLGDALALLFPIDWPEPFGLVLIESMACGTPVIAYRNGAVPEVIASGISGFVVESMDGAVDAVRRLEGIERARVRACFESRFTAERMANDYLTIYSRLTGIDHPPGPSIRSISGNGASIANGPVSERERL